MYNKPKINVLLRTNFLCAFFLLTITAFAQKATIVRGRVTDEKGKEAIPYVNVQFDGTSIGATSDIDGNFYLETKTSVSKLKVSYVGYRTQTLPVNPGQMNDVSVKLVEGSNDLQEVVVKVAKYRNKSYQYNK
jgi:CarboxypepD_reg-like domain